MNADIDPRLLRRDQDAALRAAISKHIESLPFQEFSLDFTMVDSSSKVESVNDQNEKSCMSETSVMDQNSVSGLFDQVARKDSSSDKK